tara:strand:- start:152 stop:616 length:465 start_codon:yes stop_codon:yes gene_type:complete
MSNVSEIEAFLSNLEEETKANSTPAMYVQRDKLVATIDEDSGYSDLFTGYIVEGYTEGIEGQYGVSTAVRVIAPQDGRRMTLWLTGFEQEHFKNSLSSWNEDGGSYPYEIKFLRHKVLGRNGRHYNRFSASLLSSGEAVTVPPVPEDQLQQSEN